MLFSYKWLSDIAIANELIYCTHKTQDFIYSSYIYLLMSSNMNHKCVCIINFLVVAQNFIKIWVNNLDKLVNSEKFIFTFWKLVFSEEDVSVD